MKILLRYITYHPLEYTILTSQVYHSSENTKDIAQTEKEQVGPLTSAERGLHMTVFCCMNPTGHYNAPLGTLGLGH
jgi:hypothetical protein